MRLLSIPALLIGIVIAILFFKVYGLVTRPAVPMPVATIVSAFAPDVQIGARVSDARHGVAAMTFVPHLGYVGVPNSHGANTPTGRTINFSQVRLLLDERTRSERNPNPDKARVDAVEVVTADAAATDDIGTAIAAVIRRVPIMGCIKAPDEDHLRQAMIWITPNERGGVAMISDFFLGSPSPSHGPYMTSVVAFVGKFDGGRTLRANYTNAACTQVSPPTS